MANMLREGSSFLAQAQKAHASSPVTFKRDEDTVDVQAVIGRTEFQFQDSDGNTVTFQSRDYLILTADLVLGGNEVTPRAGDKILEVAGTTTFTYEVQSPDGGDVWKYSDPFRQVRRIHTKLIKTEVA